MKYKSIIKTNKFNGFSSRNNLPEIKDGTYVINTDEYESIGTHWITFYEDGDNRIASYNAIYFDSFGVIYRIQAYDSIMYGFIEFRIAFIDFMLKGKSLLDYTNLFSPNDYEKNDKTILKCFQ